MNDFPYRFRILSFRVIDGDSVEAHLDLGLDIQSREVIRLLGVDAPEVRTRNLDEKARGIAAREWMKAKMEAAEKLVCESIHYRRGKYGRVLGSIVADGVNLNEQIILEGFAEVY